MNGFTRRDFLKGGSAAALALSLGHLRFAPGALAADDVVLKEYPYHSWEDLYRRKWQWDKVARTTHFVNCWYQGHCAWNVYLKDGIVWREEQVGEYPQTRPDLPDFNPRGCQKGACFSHRMYDPTRLKWPLKRVGERGGGKWQRISWDQALTEISDKMIDAMAKEGTDRIVWSYGPLLTTAAMSAGGTRIAALLDNIWLDMNTEIGDGHQGSAVTFGKICGERSLDDYFHTELLLNWGGNPLYTQIPNAHFYLEARYHGTEIVSISPDYSATAVHADRWIPIRIGTDAALALGMTQVILAEGLENRDFIREQTDLPFLVREDTRKYLRESDLQKGGSEETLFVFDEATKKVVTPPMRTLALGALRPALGGSYEVTALDGKKVKVRPVFTFLKERLDADYTPEKAAQLTGVPAATIRDLGRQIAKAKTVANIATSNWSKFYHGNLIERAQILLFSVCGHMGKKGSGFSAFAYLSNDMFEKFPLMKTPGKLGILRLKAGLLPEALPLKLRGYTDEMIHHEVIRKFYRDGLFVSGVLFWMVHGGLLELSEKSEGADPYLTRPIRQYLDESLERGWQFVYPKPGQPPRVLFEIGGNLLRRLRGYPQLFKHLFPNLSAFVVLETRMSSSAMYADYVLPVTSWYERSDHKWITPLQPFLHGAGKIAGAFQESKGDWEIMALLARKIEERAKTRGIPTVRDRHGNERRLDTLWNDFSFGETYTEKDEDKVAGDHLELSTNLEGVSWEDLKKKGFARFTSLGDAPTNLGNACDIKPDDTISHFTWHTEKKMIWPTLTRRIQFYIDQDFYLELGEQLPVHKDPPKSGGNYPIILSGGHTRWSIHSTWRDSAHMLRLQRGEPVMYVSLEDARARRIADGDLVEVRNDIDSFEVQAKVTPALRPGQAMLYHAWENFQFKGGKGFQNLMPTPLNPVDLGGGQYHLRPSLIQMQPSLSDRETRVEIRKV